MPLDLANAANWRELPTIEATAAPGASPWTHTPIPEQTIGTLVESPLLAVYPTFNPDPNSNEPRWRFAGFATQKLQLGISGSAAPTSQAGIWRKIWLNQLQFVNFTNWQASYGLSFQVPKWFRNWRCFSWEFTGLVPDQISLLNSIQTNAQTNLAVTRSELADIEIKADQALSLLDIINQKLP